MAKKVFKIALPGYNALTDTDPNHFALYVDQAVDYTLIKEDTRGSVSINNSSNQAITHSLGYIPLCFVFLDNGDGSFTRIYGVDIGAGDTGYTVSTTAVTISNYEGSTKSFKYYIFYDDITE
jgi:hypothetical protein